MKILHIVYQSLPNISGSSIRTRDIIVSQKVIGLDPIVISSPFQNGLSHVKCDVINNIKHYRTFNNKNTDFLVKESKTPLYKRILKSFLIFSFYKKTKEIVKNETPDIIHAHATFFCAIVAIILGRKYNIPVCYEVRSIWEEREKKETTNFIKKIQPKIITYIETLCMKKAMKVIVINKNLKREIAARGVKNISVVNNAVNLKLIKEVADKGEIRKAVSFGYIGSVSPIEGLDIAANVWKEFENEGLKNEFHIFGDGIYYHELKSLIKKLNLTNFHLHGNVDSNQIAYAFNQIDVIVNPRLKSKISDTVTPLKPLEAMAYKKLVVASDVGGMKELIVNNETGILFKSDSKDSLEHTLRNIINNGVDKTLIDNAYNYVSNEKSWLSNAHKYNEIYKSLIV